MLHPIAAFRTHTYATTFSPQTIYAARKRILKAEMADFIARIKKMKHVGEKRRMALETRQRHVIRIKQEYQIILQMLLNIRNSVPPLL